MLNRFSLGQKLALLVIIPIVALGYFSVSHVLGNLAILRETNGIVQLDYLTRDLADVMERLTAERGTSVNFILNQGKESGPELTAQRLKTDEVVGRFNARVASLDRQEFGTAFAQNLDGVTAEIGKLPGKRQQVTSL